MTAHTEQDVWVDVLADHLRSVTIQADAATVAKVAVEWLTARGFRQSDLHQTLEEMQAEIFEVNTNNGWFDSERSFGDDAALLHSEVTEMFEAFRKHRTAEVGSEAADILIRLLDTCERHDINLREEYEKKIAFNRTRGYRHGGRAV